MIHKTNQNKSLSQIYKMNVVHSNRMNQIHFVKGGQVVNAIHCLMSDSQNKMQPNKMKRNHKMKEIKDMNKTELTEYAFNLQNELDAMNVSLLDKDDLIAELQSKLEASSKDGRKSQVLSLLREYKTISILEISKLLSISTKNVSSQLTYLRSDGYMIFTDHKGRKMLIEDQETNDIQQIDDDSDVEDDS